MPLSPGDRIGPYEIVSLLGAGGMGQVYRARDTNLGRMAAIKVLPDAFLQDRERRARFQREAKVLAALNHPNIAAVYGWEERGGSSALVMELVEGRPLDELIPRKGMPLDKALEFCIQVARGLEAAHRAGIVHRDLKPSNVMVTATGVVKLLDFGLATQSAAVSPGGSSEETATDTVTLAGTAKGVIVGTVAYMSPEQAQGKDLDARSDLFSFGIMLFEMLTGKRPFSGDNQVSMLAAILREEPKAVSTLVVAPRELDRLIGRCLRKSAERRFQTASDLRVSLEELAEEASSGQLAAASLPPTRSVYRWVAAAAAIAILAPALYFTRRQITSAPHPLRQLTFESGMALMPALSPDGKLLVYASDRAGEGALDLWIRQTSGGDPHRLTSAIGVVSNPQFSPDGARVLFLSGSSIFEIPTLGGQTRRLVDNAGPFSVSSLGEIAFVSSINGVARPILIAPAAGGQPREWRSDCGSGLPPGWSSDGQRLAFVGVCGNEDGIFVAPRHGGTPVRIPSGSLGEQRARFGLWTRVQWYPGSRSPEGLILPVRNGDSVNLFRIGMDGVFSPITQGTGREADASISGNGEMVFTRAEYYPAIWSMPVDTDARAPAPPRKEAAPATLFSVSQDGSKLVFGRTVGLTKGELVARDLAAHTETVIASHLMANGGIGSFWNQLSPDGSQVVYKLMPGRFINQCLVSLWGGAPRCQEFQTHFSLASVWRPDGARIVGECEQGAICEMDPADWSVRQIVPKPPGTELLYPSYSWDGKWMAFMQRAGGVTAIAMARVRNDGSLAPQPEWVRLSPVEVKAASRPRFTQDGKRIFYIRNEGGVQHLVVQPVDLASGRPLAPPVDIAALQIYAAWFADSIGSPSSTVQVSTTRVYFNSVELRGNVWATTLY
jgi:Tol biopolymer transport system component/tRNA A-37 threonylcarbamoyl transferase component Bud32